MWEAEAAHTVPPAGKTASLTPVPVLIARNPQDGPQVDSANNPIIFKFLTLLDPPKSLVQKDRAGTIVSILFMKRQIQTG